MCPTSQVLAIINNPNICKTEEALLHWECSTIQRLWTLRINWGTALQKFCSPRLPFSHGSSFSCPPKALTRMLTRVEGGQRTSHSSLSGNYYLGGAVGRKLLPSKKPRLLQESRTGVSVCPLSCCHQGPGNPDRNPMCFVKVKGRPKLCTEGYAGTACAGCACLLIFQTVHQIHKLPIKYTREMGGGTWSPSGSLPLLLEVNIFFLFSVLWDLRTTFVWFTCFY